MTVVYTFRVCEYLMAVQKRRIPLTTYITYLWHWVIQHWQVTKI